jgi:hypothetical protein
VREHALAPDEEARSESLEGLPIHSGFARPVSASFPKRPESLAILLRDGVAWEAVAISSSTRIAATASLAARAEIELVDAVEKEPPR